MFRYSPLFIKVLRHTGIHLLFAHPQSTTKGTPPAAVQSSNTSITSAARAAPSAPPPFAQSKFRVSPSPSMHSRKFFSHTVWCFGFFCVSSTLFFFIRTDLELYLFCLLALNNFVQKESDDVRTPISYSDAVFEDEKVSF